MPAHLPLAGLTVIELGHSVAAPYAALVLAELGAEVIKVERPGQGDDARAWGPPFVDGSAVMFTCLNRHKESVEINLKTEEGLAKIRALAKTADIFLQNLRPGQAESLGLGSQALCAANPKLIYASISAFGDEGPLAQKPGYDPLSQAFGGIMSVTGEENRPSVRVGTSIVDMGSGMWIVIGVLAALHTRNQTGKGGAVGTSLYETALGWMGYHIPIYSAAKKLPRKQGSGTISMVPYQLFNTTDSEIMVAAGNDNLFRKLTEVLNKPEWAEDPRYRENKDRVVNREELCAAIAILMAKESTATWMERLEKRGIPCAPVQTVDQVIANAQTQAIDILREGPNDVTYVGLPVRFDGKRPSRNDPPPRLGANNAKVAK
jgi:crotonobetainyl-CoA:carnitine CoA-transferase CaiB-like acyl-CoA transferase